MIEPTGTAVDVFGVGNTQSKNVGAYAGGKGQKQTMSPEQLQDDPASLGLSAPDSNEAPGPTQRLSSSGKQGQDSGSIQGAFSAGLGQLNKGTPEKIGHFAVSLPGQPTKENKPDADPGSMPEQFPGAFGGS